MDGMFMRDASACFAKNVRRMELLYLNASDFILL